MRVGDLLEWAAAATSSTATWLATQHAWPGMLVAAGWLTYQAQCHGTTPLPHPSRPAWLHLPHRARKAKP